MDSSHPLWSKTMIHWYSNHFKDSEAYFTEWFKNLGVKQEFVKQWLISVLNNAPPVETRVSLMLQGAEHFPEEPIESFIGKSLRRIKPSGFVKAIKPTISQMPLVLKMAQRLYEKGYKELGQSIALAVFVELLIMKPNFNNPQLQYNVIEAWSLLSEYNLDLLPTQYMEAAKSRVKSSILYKDSITMIKWACGVGENLLIEETPNELCKKNALLFLPVVLKEVIAQHQYGEAYIKFFCRIYPQIVITPEVHELFYTLLEKILQKEKRGDNSLLKFLNDHYPDRKEKNWELWRLKNGKVLPPNDFLLNLFNANNNYISKNAEYIKSILEYYNLNDIISVLYDKALYIYDFEKIKQYTVWGRRNATSSAGQGLNVNVQRQLEKIQLGEIDKYFKLLTIMCPQMKNNKKFELLARAASMSYLYMCKTSNSINEHHKPFNGLFPNLLDQPLSLLNSLYSDQRKVINKIIKSLYNAMSLDPSLNINILRQYYEELYSTFSGILFEHEQCRDGTIQTLCNVGDLSVFEYFSNLSQDHVVNFDGLDETIFNLS